MNILRLAHDRIFEPVSLDDAVAICCESVQPVDAEYRNIYDAYMRVAADNLTSPIDIPGFDRSAVDGYAIGHIDLGRLQGGRPLRLRMVSTVGAGSTGCRPIRPAETCRIMTGAPLPEGTAAVIKQEDTERDGDYVVICGSRSRGENIRKAGHELGIGDGVAAKGQVLKAEIIERVAACGIESIPIFKKPRVFVIDTGNELLLPGSPLKTGCIYGSSRSLLACKITGNGAAPLMFASVIKDDLPAIAAAVKKAALAADMVIVCGGTGNGLYDLVHGAFVHLNARLLFKGMSVHPGKGTSAATFRGKLLINLSGNPSAAGMLFEALVKPALFKLKGDSSYAGGWFDIELGRPINNLRRGRSLHRGEMVIERGRAYALPTSRKVVNTAHIPILLDVNNSPEGITVKAKLTSD